MPRSSWLALALIACLAGCPEPPAPAPGGGAAGRGDGSGGGRGDGSGGGRGDGSGGGRGDGSGGAPAGQPPADWVVIPEAQVARAYPLLQPLATWPDPSGLRSPSSLPAERRPQESERRQLLELVRLVVAEGLQPGDPEAALGVDARGRLFLGLGPDGRAGSASLRSGDGAHAPRTFAIVLRGGAAQVDAAGLEGRVKSVVRASVAAELTGEGALEPSPQLQASDGVAGLALLDPSSGGLAIQFPYLYGYVNASHTAVVLQEVPHMAVPPGD